MSSSVAEISQEPGPWRSFVIMSGYHDYRSKRKADLHFIADELKKQGEVSFFSVRYSYLTRYKEDPRHDLWERANRNETVNGIGCYLWRTPIHPFRLPSRFALIEKAGFAAFSSYLPKAMRAAIKRTDIVFVESGISIIYLPLIKRLNPNVRIIYLASDSLDTIGQAGAIKDALRANADLIDGARVPSPYLARDLPRQVPCYYIPHGIDKAQFERIGTSPFSPGSVNAVSVGSMLFDPGFFESAGKLFPNITFHVIGSGYAGAGPHNVRYYPEMPFEKTLPFLKYSAFAIAPYRSGVAPYLTHTSMKLMQYNYLGIPAVCPEIVTGAGYGRFGYDPERPQTIKTAIENALDSGGLAPQPQLDWRQVTRLIMGMNSAGPVGEHGSAAAGVGELIRLEDLPAGGAAGIAGGWRRGHRQ
jgi:2-beta-glucuronyltransferase